MGNAGTEHRKKVKRAARIKVEGLKHHIRGYVGFTFNLPDSREEAMHLETAIVEDARLRGAVDTRVERGEKSLKFTAFFDIKDASDNDKRAAYDRYTRTDGYAKAMQTKAKEETVRRCV